VTLHDDNTVIHHTGAFHSSLLDWEAKQMKSTAIDAARLLALLWLCLEVNTAAQAGDTIRQAGDILNIALPASALGLTLAHRDYQGTLQFGESAALTLGVTYTLKYTVDETRPNGGGQSFPSGHSSTSFCSAEFMRKRYGWDYGIPAYAAASFVAYSRVESGEHFPRDVVAGAAIGILSSYLFTKPYKGWQLQPDVGEKYYGLRLSHSW
jgi:membrane-associated phospholipid phosphatase